MIKHTVTSECETDEDLMAIVNASRNQMLIDCLYDDVFRPVIKYSDNENDISAYEQVWKKVSEHFKE
jgi:hypothetical protein